MNESMFTFQPISAKRMSEATRTNIRDNIIPFFAKDQQQWEKDEPDGVTACYERLSVDDKMEGESNSIANQKKILERYCREHGYSGIRHYQDDGYSGVTFDDRPGFQAMLADIKAGKIARVLVKDMSRVRT